MAMYMVIAVVLIIVLYSVKVDVVLLICVIFFSGVWFLEVACVISSQIYFMQYFMTKEQIKRKYSLRSTVRRVG